MNQKSSVEEIRARFDADVERFSNLETGQAATIDAPLSLELIAQAARSTSPHAKSLLDIGCGAGNYSLRVLQELPDLDVTLNDLSQPMLERALERVGAATNGSVTILQNDVRALNLGENRFDVIVAAAVLHHLREENEWDEVFAKFYAALRPGGSLWISDLIEHTSAQVQNLMFARYGDYLAGLGGDEYRDKVFAYIKKEDTPRPLIFQLDAMRAAGFCDLEVLHKNSCFAAFGGVKR